MEAPLSSRPQFTPYPAITAGDMSGNITSKVTVIQKLSLISYSASWSGTSPVGELIAEVSNDYTQDGQGVAQNAGTWNILPLDVPALVSGNTGNGFIDIELNSGYALRIRYARTSGTGSLQVIVNAKVS